jgi:hypothetical protein
MGLLKKSEPQAPAKPEYVQRAEPQIMLNVPEEQQTFNVEEAIGRISIILAESKNPKALSDLDDSEIRLISALIAVAESDDVKDQMLQSFISNLLVLKVSHMRKGRREIIDLARGIRDQQQMGWANRVRSVFGGPGR